MSLISLSIKHGRTQADARQQLEQVVDQVRSQFQAVIRSVVWSPERNAVKIEGTGFSIDMTVDAVEVHVRGDIPLLANLLGGPLMSGLKGILEDKFQKKLT